MHPGIDGALPTVSGDDDGTAHTFVGTPVAPLRPGLASGEVLAGRYAVLRMLGSGGMGDVYAVHDRELEEDVALKLLRATLSEDASYRQRLRSEVRLARRVSHPNVCRVHDLGQHREHLFVTMELVRGRTLRAILRDQQAGTAPPMPLAAVVDVIVQLSSALAAAHRAGVLHRDVKPDNLMVDDGRAVLTDFGVASLAGEGSTRVVVGTPAYVAPEVLRGEPFDHRCDVFATAVVAYELIAGALPFPARTMQEALDRAMARLRPPPLPSAAGTAPLRAALEDVLSAALDPDPARRTPSVDRLAEGLAAAAVRADAGEVVARATVTPQPSSQLGQPSEAATPTTAAIRRPELRIATVLVFHCDAHTTGGETMAVIQPNAVADPTARTQIVPVELPGEDLERLVVGLGGLPLAVSDRSLTALFGAPVALGDDAVRAVRAARALVERTIGGHAGVDTLRVMVRPGAAEPVGPEAQRLAGAIAAAAPAGKVWLSAAAARQVAAHVDVAPVDDVAGQRALEVVGHGKAVGASPASRVRPRELARLEALARTCFEERTPCVVEVRGPAGAGKTRLREALVARVSERREVDWLIARAAPLGEAAPLSLLRTADPSWVDAALHGGGDRNATLAAARRWLEARANRRPVAVVFEDLQWADELSRALVQHLATNLDRAPILVVTFARDDAAPLGAQTITLEPLDDAAALELAREVAPSAADDALADVVARAGGNPYFVEELARELAEGGGGLLPATVEAAVQARIDRLSGVAADVLAAGAVVGRAFWREAARAALPSPLDDAALDAALAELERRGLCHPTPPVTVDDDRYELAQAVVRDVAYQRLPPRDRRRAHAAVARWVEQQKSTDQDLLLALAHHREHGGDRAGAAAAWQQAGARCLELYAYAQAHGALARAVELSDKPDAVTLELLGQAALEGATFEAAEDALERALAIAPEEAKPRILLRLGQAASSRAAHARAIQWYEDGLARVGDRDPKTAALLYGGLGWVLAYQLSAADPRGLEYCERAVEMLEGTPHRRELARALSRLGGAYMRAGRWSEQRSVNQRNLVIAQELGDQSSQITARINLGVVHISLGDVDLAIEHTEAALRLCRRTGARATEGLAASNLAGCLLERGDLDAAERRLTEGVRLLERTGSRRVLPESRTFLARLHARRGDLDAAAQAARAALALSRELDVDLDVAMSLRILAQIDARRGQRAAARASIASAAMLVGDDPFERARIDAARWRIDKDADARTRAADTFARLGARLDLEALDDAEDVR